MIPSRLYQEQSQVSLERTRLLSAPDMRSQCILRASLLICTVCPTVSRRRKSQSHHINQFRNMEVPKAGPSKKELIQDALNQPSTALLPTATSYDEYSGMCCQ